MYRNGFIGLIFALVLLWGGTAMAQLQDRCNLTGDVHQILTFPYYAGTEYGFWNGMAIINTTGNAIPASDLCIVGAHDGAQFGVDFPEDLAGESQYINMVDRIDPSLNKYGIALSVFSNNESARHLRGFGMIGDGTQAQGYLALRGDHVQGADVLEFPYVPGEAFRWWTGFSIFNNAGVDQVLTYHVTYRDGQVLPPITKNIKKDEALVGTFSRLLRDAGHPARTDMQARVEVRASIGNIVGFAMMGDGKQAQGIVAPN